MWKLILEETIKNILDKFIFGLVAMIVLLYFQGSYEKNQRLQIEREVVLTLERDLILTEAKKLRNDFSGYVFLIAKNLALGVSPSKSELSELLGLRVSVQTSIEAMSVYDDSLILDARELSEDMESLNYSMRFFEGSEISEYRQKLENLKVDFQVLLAQIQNSAIESLRKMNDDYRGD